MTTKPIPVCTLKRATSNSKNVSFKYNAEGKRNVVDSVNLHIAAGETVGVIGGTGSAKTTLVSLIPRLYDVTAGEVLVDGRNVKDYTIYELRESVSMVLQNNVLFSGSILDNLRWGDENATKRRSSKRARRRRRMTSSARSPTATIQIWDRAA